MFQNHWLPTKFPFSSYEYLSKQNNKHLKITFTFLIQDVSILSITYCQVFVYLALLMIKNRPLCPWSVSIVDIAAIIQSLPAGQVAIDKLLSPAMSQNIGMGSYAIGLIPMAMHLILVGKFLSVHYLPTQIASHLSRSFVLWNGFDWLNSC